MINIEKLNEELSYDELTGELRRKRNGQVAGSKNKNGYVKVFFDGKLHYAHRLAWCLFNGSEPTSYIDHVNGDKQDNSISNIREATPAQNQMNRVKGSNNKSGHTGVTFRSDRGKWRSQIYQNGKLIYLGLFSEKKDAANAYKEAAKKYGDEFFTNGVNS